MKKVIFQDGSEITSADFLRLTNLLFEALQNKLPQERPVELVIDSVKIKGVTPKKITKPLEPGNAIKAEHAGYNIRLWVSNDLYCCNITGQHNKYIELSKGEFKSELGAIKFIKQYIEDNYL